jgi:hypothetical protein
MLLVAGPMKLTWVFALALGAGACTGDGKPDEEELELIDQDGKDDSFKRPTEHGVIQFGVSDATALTDTERHHAWTFELTGDARVDMTTSYALLGQRRTDTVMYLYREGQNGWGPYLFRNDDYGSTIYSQLIKNLGAGRYRVLVKGHQATTRGKFKLTVNCAGDGCAPAVDPNACLFGSVYHDLETNPNLSFINKMVITAATLDTLTPADQHRLMLAVQQSSHTDVTTPLEAIGRVDQGEVNVSFWFEPAARRAYIAFEYGAGDNSYGAIFDRHSGDMVTNIHDGDLEHCTVKAETCLLPEDWNQLKTSTAFAIESTRTVSDAAQVTGVTAEQALIAFRQSFDDVTSVADGLSRVDDNEIDVVALQHKATGVRLDVVAYHAGDTSVGRIYFRGTTDRAGIINDLFIEGCQLFE